MIKSLIKWSLVYIGYICIFRFDIIIKKDGMNGISFIEKNVYISQ